MEWHWPLAIVVVAVLLFGYCTYSAQQSSRSVDRALESFDEIACYEAGYNAAMAGRPQPNGPSDDPDCVRSLESGYADGRRTYDAYGGFYEEY
jgi:hypothetical protein